MVLQDKWKISPAVSCSFHEDGSYYIALKTQEDDGSFSQQYFLPVVTHPSLVV